MTSGKKGPALSLKDLEESEVKFRYLLNHKHFVINYRKKNIDRNNIYVLIIKLRS